ncbi:MAG TPA: DUF3108 domain-containing protein [Candidatus Sulfotelmatobacter sp.]
MSSSGIQLAMSQWPARCKSFCIALLAGAGLLGALPSPAQNAQAQAAQPRIVSPPDSYHFPNGKNFVYAVEWHSFNAATSSLRFDLDGTQEKLTGQAKTAGAVNFIFPVRSWFDARIDPRTYCSTHIFKHSEEGKRRKEVQIQFDPARTKTVFDEKNLKTGESRHQEDDAPSCATDILSGFFYLGSLSLSVGSFETFPVVDGGVPTVVQAHAEAREDIKVQAGDFHTVRVDLLPLSGKFQGKGEIWVWYNEGQFPVQMRARLPWGTVTFKLQRIEQ